MKEKIHPKYVECRVHCGCGNEFMTRATIADLHVDICSACHPFYTGKQKFVDTAGRIEKFNKKFKGYDSGPTGVVTPADAVPADATASGAKA